MVESTTSSVLNFSTLLNETPKDSVSPPLACSLVTSLSVSSLTSFTKLYVLPNFVAGFSLLCHLSVFLVLFTVRVLRENTDLPPPGRLIESVVSSLSFSSLLPNSLASAIGETNLEPLSFFSSTAWATVSAIGSVREVSSVISATSSSAVSTTSSTTGASSTVSATSSTIGSIITGVSSTASTVSSATSSNSSTAGASSTTSATSSTTGASSTIVSFMISGSSATASNTS